MNYGKEFRKFAMSEKGVSGLNLDYFEKHIEGVTPYILEEREMRATQIDIFSRLMMDRIIWVSGPVESQMASIIQAQLIFLETTDKKDISM
jgi:ATP-dependent Clp protease protease subunit